MQTMSTRDYGHNMSKPIKYRTYEPEPGRTCEDIFEAHAYKTGTVVEYWQSIIDTPIEKYPDHLRGFYAHNQKIAKQRLEEYTESQKGSSI